VVFPTPPFWFVNDTIRGIPGTVGRTSNSSQFLVAVAACASLIVASGVSGPVGGLSCR